MNLMHVLLQNLIPCFNIFNTHRRKPDIRVQNVAKFYLIYYKILHLFASIDIH